MPSVIKLSLSICVSYQSVWYRDAGITCDCH